MYRQLLSEPIADGFLQALGGDQYPSKKCWSGGSWIESQSRTGHKESGIDISQNTSNVIDQDTLNRADYIITLCGHADEHCPVILNPNVVKWHWGFEDPAKATGTEDEIMVLFRNVRDAIKKRIIKL